MLMMFLGLDLSGLVVLRLRLQMPIGFQVALHRMGVWFSGVGGPCLGLSGLVDTGFGMRGAMLLTLLMLLTSSYTVILLLLDMKRRFKRSYGCS